ncbi:plasmid replication, integration and excision activator [Streptosporangium sp. NPDC048865]|uniref:plasmid replication, integration and excision activator n=1 Tax=Streptosporangium sp. NPDC048865 TaxID=3155766 RepID=UPI0034302DEF
MQQRDKESGLPLWAVSVLDADPAARAKGKAVQFKIASAEMPELPELPAELAAVGVPFIPLVLDGLTITPWLDGNKVALSYRATGIRPVPVPAKAAKGRDPITPINP